MPDGGALGIEDVIGDITKAGGRPPEVRAKEAGEEIAQRTKISEGQVNSLQQYGKTIQDLNKKLSGIGQPAAPKLQNVPQAPQQTPQDPFASQSNFGTTILFASLAGAFTRAPLTVAMNSAAEYLKGFHEGDKERMERSRQNWKDSMETALAQNKVETERYRAALENKRASVDQILGQIQAAGAAAKNDQMVAAAQSGNLDAIHQIKDGLDKSAEALEKQLFIHERNRALEQRSHAVQDRKKEEAQGKVDTVVNQIDAAMAILKKSEAQGKHVAGAMGMVNRLGELVLPGDTNANQFAQLIETIKMQIPPIVRGSSKALGADKQALDTIVPGLSAFKNNEITYNDLAQLKRILSRKDIVSPDVGAEMPMRVRQNGVEYELQPDGAYEPVQ